MGVTPRLAIGAKEHGLLARTACRDLGEKRFAFTRECHVSGVKGRLLETEQDRFKLAGKPL